MLVELGDVVLHLEAQEFRCEIVADHRVQVDQLLLNDHHECEPVHTAVLGTEHRVNHCARCLFVHAFLLNRTLVENAQNVHKEVQRLRVRYVDVLRTHCLRHQVDSLEQDEEE